MEITPRIEHLGNTQIGWAYIIIVGPVVGVGRIVSNTTCVAVEVIRGLADAEEKKRTEPKTFQAKCKVPWPVPKTLPPGVNGHFWKAKQHAKRLPIGLLECVPWLGPGIVLFGIEEL